MKLTTIEIQSGLWNKLVDHYTPLLAKLRARAENPSLTEAERMPLLWQIAHIKNLFEMAETPPEKKMRET